MTAKTRLSDKQVSMLADFKRDGEATDLCDFEGPGGWHNRERVISALHRKGMLDADGITPLGERTLALRFAKQARAYNNALLKEEQDT